MFRFQNLIVWQEAIVVSDSLFDIADEIDTKRRYRFSEQLRGAALSITNNIAEGSGSFSDREFASYLNISRRSVFECANMLMILSRRNLVSPEQKTLLLDQLNLLSGKITNFRKSLIKKK